MKGMRRVTLRTRTCGWARPYSERPVYRLAKGGLLRTCAVFPSAIAAAVVLSTGLAPPVFASSAGSAAGGIRGAPTALTSPRFAGYAIPGQGEGSWKVAAQ